MIIPSIDISGGRAVQLVGGEKLALDAGDPVPILERFAVAGEVAVVDIDAARGDGSNERVIRDLCRRARVRVGGGIRDAATATRWLDAGAARVVLGTAATPSVLEHLPADRVIVALDTRDGRVVTHGWRRRSDATAIERVAALRHLVGGFLVTFVEREGRMAGSDLTQAAEIVAAAGEASVTIAGGVTTAEEIAYLDRIGADAQVGMALYTGRLPLAEAITAPLSSDRADGLWPTVIVDTAGIALGLAYSSAASVGASVEHRRGIYESRSRGVWEKGGTSGATQEIVAIDLDCDRDTLRFTVRQRGSGFCHLGTRTCWGDDDGLTGLARRLATIAATGGPRGSNTARLVADPDLLAAKLREEAVELGAAARPAEVVADAADLLYFTLVKTAAAGVAIEEIERELNRRRRAVTRRAMEAKEDIG